MIYWGWGAVLLRTSKLWQKYKSENINLDNYKPINRYNRGAVLLQRQIHID